jgi:hypothetical protein
VQGERQARAARLDARSLEAPAAAAVALERVDEVLVKRGGTFLPIAAMAAALLPGSDIPPEDAQSFLSMAAEPGHTAPPMPNEARRFARHDKRLARGLRKSRNPHRGRP